MEERAGRTAGGTRWMRRATAAVGAAALLALAGCGPGEEELVAQAEEDQLAAPLEVAWESDDELISEIRWAGDVALAYVRDGDAMQVVARDFETGEELWREPALYGMGANEQMPAVPVIEREEAWYASFYTTSEDSPGHHEVVDVQTGEPLRPDLSQEIFADRPYSCGDTFCAAGEWWYQTGDSGYFAESQEVAFDFGSERWRPREDVDGTESQDTPALAEDAYRYGPHLSISKPGDSGEDLVGFSVDGEVRWERPYAEVFGHENTEDRSLHYSDGDDDFPLILSAWPYGESGGDEELDSLTSALRLDVSTGETLWEAQGMDLSCDYGSLSGDELIEFDPTVVIACGYDAGTRTFSEDEDGQTTWEDQDVEQYIVGLDIETGEQLWRVDVDADAELEESDTSILNDFRYEDVPSRDGRAVTIDLVTGDEVTSRDVYEPTVFCVTGHDSVEMRRYTEREDGTWSMGDDLADVARYGAKFPCDRDELTAVDEMPTVAELRRIGYEDEEEVVVLSGPDGMVAYEIPAVEEFREDA